ncbi:cell division topological specificity factor MinE [Roseomonas sp. GC11]|uniref:cell division topological specificity factor MinE n=1 Tax=Roseomonas sp. GC11 TaxID=2950546 RepID=UPI00210D6535|nr:cell division topological specificity factor MinE [Roseomonas sp. GC11]MCQ4160167.1 cell division topological specificity factor MinE [Roseomonas sp. GC11]
MSWLDVFRVNRKQAPTPAGAAKERLQIVLAHERISRTGDDFLPRLQRELIQVVARYVAIDPKAVNVSLDRGGDMSTLAIEVELPAPASPPVEAAPAAVAEAKDAKPKPKASAAAGQKAS